MVMEDVEDFLYAEADLLDTWQIEPNMDLLGGRVVITTRPGFPEDGLYERMAANLLESWALCAAGSRGASVVRLDDAGVAIFPTRPSARSTTTHCSRAVATRTRQVERPKRSRASTPPRA